MMVPRPLVILCLFALAGGQAFSQTPVASSPQARSLAGQALQSLAGMTALSDVTIQANAYYVAGSDEETGTASLVARGNAQSVVTLNLSGGQRREIRNGIAGVSVAVDCTTTAMATHNCFIDSDWYFPALSLAALSSDPTQVVSLVGQQAYDGVQVYHLVLFHNLANGQPGLAPFVQQVSAMDLYLDASSLQPVALGFNAHPDYDAGTSFPVEIRFGAYQKFQECYVEHRVYSGGVGEGLSRAVGVC